jgi:hypothetical protein
MPPSRYLSGVKQNHLMTKVKLVNLPEIPPYGALMKPHIIKLFTVFNLEKRMLVCFKNMLCGKNVLFFKSFLIMKSGMTLGCTIYCCQFIAFSEEQFELICQKWSTSYNFCGLPFIHNPVTFQRQENYSQSHSRFQLLHFVLIFIEDAAFLIACLHF